MGVKKSKTNNISWKKRVKRQHWGMSSGNNNNSHEGEEEERRGGWGRAGAGSGRGGDVDM